MQLLDVDKTKFIVISLVIVIILIASLGIYLIEDGAGGITAMEGKEIADEIAKEWSQDAVLSLIHKGSLMIHDGYFQIWGYYYLDSPIINNTTKCIGITVESNGDTFITHNISINGIRPITDFSIDSDEVYDIAKEIPDIASFIKTNPSVEVFSLDASTGDSIWTIEWVGASVVDHARLAQVQIDANTGEVLFVQVYN